MANCKVAPGEEGGTKLTFDHQCFLMDYADVLSPLNRGCPYENFHAIDITTGDSPHDIISTFTKRKSLEKLIRLKPADHGILQPMVRLWRVFPKSELRSDTRAEEEAEFIFSSHINSENVASMTAAQGSLARLGGVGLKKFEWEFAGTNPAEADKVIGVNMTLHFQTMGDLTKNWSSTTNTDNTTTWGATSGTRGESPSFMELILLPPAKHGTSGVCNRPNKAGYNPDYYQIKATVGWARPISTEDIDPVLLRELEATQLTMYLNLITHEIKINDDGSLDVDVEYVGAMEAAVASKDADVLFPSTWHGAGSGATVSGGFLGFGVDDRTITDIDAEAEALEAALASNDDQTECAAGDEDELDELADERADMEEELDELQELQKELNDENRSTAYAAFTDAIQSKIRHLDLDNGFLEDWQANENNNRIALTGDDSGGVVTITIGDDSRFNDPEDVAADADETDVADDDIYFVFFGDIIEVACLAFSPGNVRSPKSPVKNMKIMLGPMSYINMREPENRNGTPNINMISMADIPISYTMFLKFWNEKVIEPERDSYSVRAFIQDVLQNLVSPALQPGCFPNGPRQSTAVARAAFTVSSPGGAVDIVSQCAPNPTSGRVSLTAIKNKISGTGSSTGATGDESGFQYLLFYMNSADIGNGERATDEARGIYHYSIGEDRGLIKKIDFKKNDIQGMKEARQDSSGAFSQLREMYNADVKMVGNNIYIPGMTLFLWPPPGLGNPANLGSAANLLGIGGYFNVIKVRSSISRGSTYNTDLECIFVAASKDIQDGTATFDCQAADVPVPDTYRPSRDYDAEGAQEIDENSVESRTDDPCNGEPS